MLGPLCNTPVAIPPGQDPNIRMERHINNECSVMTGRKAKSSTPTCARPKCGKVLFSPIRCDVSTCPFLYTLAHKLIIVPSPVSSSSVRNTASPRTTRAPPRTVLLPSSYLRPVLGRTCRTRQVLLQPRLWLQSSVRPQARLQAVRDHQPLVASPSLHP